MTDAEADAEAARLTLVAMLGQPWLDQPTEVLIALNRIALLLHRMRPPGLAAPRRKEITPCS